MANEVSKTELLAIIKALMVIINDNREDTIVELDRIRLSKRYKIFSFSFGLFFFFVKVVFNFS